MKDLFWNFCAWVGFFNLLSALKYFLVDRRRVHRGYMLIGLARRERLLYEKWEKDDPERAAKHINDALEMSKKALRVLNKEKE